MEQLPSTFAQTVARVKTFVLPEIDREAATKQLYYHTRAHISGVQHRANIIFQAIAPYWQASPADKATSDYLARMQLLLELCAVAHDMVQIFIPQTQPHTSRRREAGVSETLTVQKLLDYIQRLNQQLQEHGVDDSARFTDADLSLIQEAIAATICTYDPSEQAIYQPALYDSDRPLSTVAIILALADIGSLGMEGIAAYNREGSLLFLEENPDVIPILLNLEIGALASENFNLYENIRQRLLKRACFQVNFAKSRLHRYVREISALPGDATLILTRDVFQYLKPSTIQKIESTTPTDADTPLEKLVDFFKLNEYIANG
ncbi:MAG TPA: hypothetical protein DDZ80_30215 [Cyanobacteria bacterium UBA8803]|nr:hypothetical protein [Cyanobacteria bacterium UBA9273]HBL62509.1 hypothetical protein [Cyanobacteria bacterium UBA8803]